MKPIKLTISGFRSFRAPCTIEFPRGPSFVQLTGRNDAAPELGANGVGKSGLLDAISWVLFGVTIRGLKGPKTRNWFNQDQTYVELTFQHRHVDYTIFRSAKPNRITLRQSNGEARSVDQQRVRKLLGFDHATFLNTIVLGQFEKFFFDLNPAAKLQVFSEALNLSVWDRAREATTARMNEIVAQAAGFEREKTMAEGRAQELAALNEDADARKMKGIEEQIAAAQVVVDEKIKILNTLRSRSNNGRFRAGGINDQHAGHKKKLGRLRRASSVNLGRQLKAKAKIALQETRIEELRQQVKDLKKLKTRDCPTCLAPVTAEHVDRIRRTVKFQICGHAASRAYAERTVRRLQTEATRLEAAAKIALDKVNSVAQERARARERQRHFEEEVSRADHNRNEAIKRMQEFQWDALELGKEVEVRKQRRLRVLAEIKRISKNIARYKRRIRRCEAWQERFKNIRLWVVDTAISELRSLTNAYVVELGLKGWRVEFSVDRAGAKRGSTIRGFSVHIYSPESPEHSVPFSAFSGGESQRLRIAGALALAELLRNRLDVTVPWLALDEPTAHLSIQGVEDLLRFLAEYSKRTYRSIWLIDHRSTHSGHFDHHYIAVKTDEGSTIVKKD